MGCDDGKPNANRPGQRGFWPSCLKCPEEDLFSARFGPRSVPRPGFSVSQLVFLHLWALLSSFLVSRKRQHVHLPQSQVHDRGERSSFCPRAQEEMHHIRLVLLFPCLVKRHCSCCGSTGPTGSPPCVFSLRWQEQPLCV